MDRVPHYICNDDICQPSISFSLFIEECVKCYKIRMMIFFQRNTQGFPVTHIR